MTRLTSGSGHAGPPRAAVLESSAAYRATLAALVRDEGWAVRMHVTFAGLVAAMETAAVDVVVLNITDVPDAGPGIRGLLALFDGPLVVLADDDNQLKAALRSGATLAIRKPYDPEYLLLSVRALLERSRSLREMLGSGTAVGDVWVGLSNHTVERAGRRQVLGPGEWQLFAFLLANPGRTFSRNDLARGAWGAGYHDRVAQVELYISRLRRKVERNPHRPQVLVTVRREGYRLVTSTPLPPPSHSARVPEVADADWQPAARWYLMSAYREIIDVGERLLEHSADAVDAAGGADQVQIRGHDLPLIEAAMGSAQSRLTHWETLAD